MKLAFSTKQVKTDSFLKLCNVATEYGFNGFEIASVEEIKAFSDGIFSPSETAGAKRKLVNRHLTITAINCPEEIDNATDYGAIIDQIEYASSV